MTLRLSDDRTIATSGAARRVASTALCRLADPFGLLAFAIADTHVHVLLAADRLRAGECARRLEISLQRRLTPHVRFQQARVRPVQSQSHLQHSFAYVLRQLERHGLDLDPARDGTSLPDLLGLRVVGSNMRARVAALMPRVDLAALEGGLDLGPRPPDRLDYSLLPEAAAAAFGLADLAGRDPLTAKARHTAAHVPQHLSLSDLGHVLAISASFANRLRKEPVNLVQLRAVQLQLNLRTSIAERRPVIPPETVPGLE